MLMLCAIGHTGLWHKFTLDLCCYECFIGMKLPNVFD